MASESIGVADIGASGGRVSMFTRDAAGYSLEAIHEFTHPLHDQYLTDRGGGTVKWRMWNPAVIFEGMTDGIRRIGANGTTNLVSFGLDSWGSDGVWLSADGDMAFPSYSCHSPSFTGAFREIEPLMPSRERYALTGVYPDDFLVVNQVYWVNRHKPELVDFADMFMPLASLYNYWFSGEKAMEYTWATTGHLASCLTHSYCGEMFSRLDMRKDKLPPLREPGTILGNCTAALAGSLGLAGFKIVLPSNHDTACAFASVDVKPGRTSMVISAGTWWCMGMSLAEPLVTDAGFDAYFSNVAGYDSIVYNVINMGSLPAQVMKRLWEWEDGEPMTWEKYNFMAAMASAPDLRFDIDDPRLRSASDMPAAVAEVAELDKAKATRGRLAALVYAGLARKAARLAGDIGGLVGKPVDEIVVIGGGVKNDLLNQWIADSACVPVRTGPPNATTLGNALIQGIAMGWFSSLAEAREATRGLYQEKVFLPGGC